MGKLRKIMSQANSSRSEIIQAAFGGGIRQSPQFCIVLMYLDFVLQFWDQIWVNEAIFGRQAGNSYKHSNRMHQHNCWTWLVHVNNFKLINNLSQKELHLVRFSQANGLGLSLHPSRWSLKAVLVHSSLATDGLDDRSLQVVPIFLVHFGLPKLFNE